MQSERRSLSLAGTWGVRLDPDDVGVRDGWPTRGVESYEHALRLPGSVQAQGLGNVPTQRTQWTASLFDPKWPERPEYARASDDAPLRFPFFLLPDREYVGPAWFARTIDVPAAWNGQRVVLTLERPHWQTRVWLDGVDLGGDDSLATPHRFTLPATLAPGRHTLVIRVDNRPAVRVGLNSHSITDHTQTNWNGIVGELSLTATPRVWIGSVRVDADDRSVARVEVSIGNSTGRAGTGAISFDGHSVPATWSAGGGRVTFDVPLDDAPTWDEFAPAVRSARVALRSDAGEDAVGVDYGVRRIEVAGTQFRVNGRPTFLRGTLECCIFPRTGYPPTDVEAWLKVFEACKSHGLNHVRFHSWCPPRAAFVAADRVGIYCQIECGVWANFDGVTIGEGSPLDAWLPREADRILAEYGNHPSFAFFAHGNEPAGERMKPFLAGLVKSWRERDPRRLYAGATGWASVDEDQFFPVMRVWEKTPARGRGGWHGGDYRDAVAAAGRPVVSHEIGQHCVFPVFGEVPKYDGHLKPTNYAIFRDSMARAGLLGLADDFVAASGALQVLCYKEDIEAALRTPGFGGFQLLGLSDFPGQGTALIGVLDAFWESKGYVSAGEFRRFCGATVPLVRLRSRVWTTAQALVADAEVAHFGPTPLVGARPIWRLERDGAVVARGELPTRDVPIGNGTALGEIRIDLATLPAPASYRLVLAVGGAENDWNVWLYPADVDDAPPSEVRVAEAFGDAERAFVESGGRLLLLPPPALLDARHPHGSFIPVFWNRLLMKDQPGQTLGLLCDAGHPALARFPTARHADWQWESICDSARYLAIDGMPATLTPIARPIDDWNTNRSLALVLECEVGAGRVIVCSADLFTDLDARPAARQLRRSLLDYLGGARLAPAARVEAATLAELVRPTTAAAGRVVFDPSMVPMTDGPT